MKYIKKFNLSLLSLAMLSAFSTQTIAAQTNDDASSETSASEQEVEKITIETRRTNLVGQAISASQGIVNQQEIAIRPILRTGEVLELVPGMVVTQHSGTGKANQYFLRGFNLDHGTDFATYVDDMPVNMRTHGHGQGYTDLNFLIPETVESLAYFKGAYYSEIGDFSGAGGANFSTAKRQSRGMAELTLGENSFQRLVVTNSTQTENGDLYYAGELNYYDGPWTDISEDLKKYNGLVRYTQKVGEGELSVSLMGYDNSWNSADQIPQRAVDQGIIDELGSLDTTVGGQSSRYSINTQWQSENVKANAYFISYDLNLWSNFTYFLDNPEFGDQFEQVDKRSIFGANASYDFVTGKLNNTVGVQIRHDDIDEVGLYSTRALERRGAIRSDTVSETSISVFGNSEYKFNDKLRTNIGARYDYFDFDVDSLIGQNVNGIDLSTNVGSESDGNFSLKGSLIYTLSEEVELYLSAGQGFHSNDARGTINQIDPVDGSQVAPVDPIAQSFGYEVGANAFISEKLNASVTLWYLTLDSELLFVGDAGNTEATRESRRQGLEVTTYYRLNDIWTLDLEYSFADAEFTDSAPEGNNIPGAIEHVVQAGASAQFDNGWFANARVRYFGERPLIEDGSVTSDSSTVVNMRLGYSFDNFVIRADLLNALDSDDHDIDYFYGSRLATEPQDAEIEDVHFHPLEPRTLRLSVSYLF